MYEEIVYYVTSTLLTKGPHLRGHDTEYNKHINTLWDYNINLKNKFMKELSSQVAKTM